MHVTDCYSSMQTILSYSIILIPSSLTVKKTRILSRKAQLDGFTRAASCTRESGQDYLNLQADDGEKGKR